LRAANIKWSGIDISDKKQMWFSQKERIQLALLLEDLLFSEGGDVGRSALWGVRLLTAISITQLTECALLKVTLIVIFTIGLVLSKIRDI
jgi:hypothetical protein